MKSKYKDYNIGIDFGTSNSCAGIYMNGTVKVAPNKIGERTTPSIVLFTNKERLVGEEALNQNTEDINNIIYEVKRFIGLNYQEFEEDGFKKYLNYDIENIDGIPKVKLIINGKIEFKTAEEISSLIIKKVVQNAEDFIAESEQVEGLKITKAIITVPAHFNENQKNAVRSAARMAGIEIPRIINEPTAAALAYGIGHDLIAEDPSKNKNFNNKSIIRNQNELEMAPLVVDIVKSEEKVIVFDLGGGTFDITLLNIKKNKEGQLVFEVELTNGDIHLGGSDFDNMMIDYCIKEFCRRTDFDEKEVRKDKKACHRLKVKCENAKKLLSTINQIIINVDNFYGEEDLYIKMTLNLFENICQELFSRINTIINDVLEEAGKNISDIDKVILVGGATRMIGVKSLLNKLFGESKIKDNINPDEAVAIGATLEAAKIEINDKMHFVLQDIVPYNIGISTINPKIDEINKGNIMYTIIKKYSKIPCSEEKTFSNNITQKNKNLIIKIYEGNDKYAEKNTKLGELKVENISKVGKIEYKLKFIIDVNGELTVQLTSDSLGINKEQSFRNITHAIVYNKKIKISKNKSIGYIGNMVKSISSSKLSIAKSYNNPEEKIKNLVECCQSYEELIESYKLFSVNNESAYEKIFNYTLELFNLYVERIKLKDMNKDNIKKIIESVKEKMKNLISIIGYMEELLSVFLKIRESCKNEFYSIFVDFMELLNNEGIEKKNKKKFSRYYSKLYFEKVFYTLKKFVRQDDLFIIDKKIKERYEKQKSINEEELKKVNSFTNFIETKIKEGKFLYGQTGFTMMGKKIEQFEQNMKSEDVQEILDLFQNMVDSFDKKENSLAEAYCLANIIKINYVIYKVKDYDKLVKYINRFEKIMDGREDEKYNWYEEIKEIIKNIEDEN